MVRPQIIVEISFVDRVVLHLLLYKLCKSLQSLEYWNIYNRIISLLKKPKKKTHPAFTYSKLTTETVEQGVKYVQS